MHLYRSVDAHGLHSPFLYQLYYQVFKLDKGLNKELKKLRRSILVQQRQVTYTDPKTQQIKSSNFRKLASRICSPLWFSQFLIQLIDYQEYKCVLETGTALGVNAAMLAQSTASTVISLEGSAELIHNAEQTFQSIANRNKISLMPGMVQDTFEEAIIRHQPQMIFLDADHRSEVLRWYMDVITAHNFVTCVVIHDIHWSPDMKLAWDELVKDSQYPLTIDVYHAGIVFLKQPMEKQHFYIRI